MIVVEGRRIWAKRMQEKRRQEGMPLPSLAFVGLG